MADSVSSVLVAAAVVMVEELSVVWSVLVWGLVVWLGREIWSYCDRVLAVPASPAGHLVPPELVHLVPVQRPDHAGQLPLPEHQHRRRRQQRQRRSPRAGRY